MNYLSELEEVVYRDKSWWKIRDDGAFDYVLPDWYNGYGDAFCKYVKTPNVAIQAGGYCGLYSRLLGEVFNTVYTFEPDPLNFFCLVMNCQSDNIIKNQGALGNVREPISVIRTCHDNKGMNRVIPLVNSITPTYVIDDLNLSDCNLIQLDTEGYEYNILLGAENTISKFRPVITVEDTNQNIVNLLAKYEYKEMMSINRDTVYAYQA